MPISLTFQPPSTECVHILRTTEKNLPSLHFSASSYALRSLFHHPCYIPVIKWLMLAPWRLTASKQAAKAGYQQEVCNAEATQPEKAVHIGMHTEKPGLFLRQI